MKTLLIKLKSEKKNQKNKEIIIGLDHNMDLLKSEIHNPTQKFLDTLMSNDILPTITRPGRITQTTATFIDNILVSANLHKCFDSALLLDDMSDQPLLTLLKQTKVTDKTPLEFKRRWLNEERLNMIKNSLLLKNWTGLLNSENVDTNFNTFCTVVSNTMDVFTPLVDIRFSAKRKYVEPMMTPSLEKASTKKLK